MGNEADPEPTDIRMTSDGFPILPKLVMDRVLNKSESEKLFRPYLMQHYCEWCQSEVVAYLIFRSPCQWKEVESGSLWSNKAGYQILYCERVPPRRRHT